MSITFYDCPTAPSPRRARILLAEKNVPHDTVEIDLRKGEQLSDGYKAINPACTVPALRLEDGTVLTENAGIAAYLEAAFPEPALLGISPLEKGLVANWNTKIELEGLWAVAETLRNSAPGLKDRAITGAVNYPQIPELAERGMARLKRFFDMLDARLEGRDFVAIDSFSLADVTAVVTVDFARIVKITAQEHHRNLIRWRESLNDRPQFVGISDFKFRREEMNNVLEQELVLPCGATLKNRIAKAAMTEGLASPQCVPTPELERLYGIWSDGGAGLLLSGNIQVDADHLERPGNVLIDAQPNDEMRAALASWAKAATRNGNHFWAQISHAGRQTPKAVNPHPKAPSPVKVGLPGGQFGQPVALTVEEIEEIVRRFGICALAVKEAGFTGVQVHAAHGYLMSEFLSPRTNLREDQYGGSLENRARALLDSVRTVRDAVGPDFPVAVKLNSADFQKGGFAFEDSLQVAQWLQQASVDLIEISGGTYEQPKLMGLAGLEEEEPQNVAQSTLMREAYFVDFAMAMQKQVTIPLMVTGGFRQRSAMEQAISSGAADVIGLGRPMCVDTDAPAQLLAGEVELKRYEKIMSLLPPWLKFLEKIPAIRGVAGFAVQYWYYAQLLSLGSEGKSNPGLSVFAGTRQLLKHERNWLNSRSGQSE